MPWKPKFTRADIRAQLNRALNAVHLATINVLAYLGEQCVIQARSVSTYHDQTGNLRNSIGYVIVHNGKVVKSNFARTAKAKQASSQDGLLRGRALANELAKNHPTGYVLIVVAGMNYAAQVESRGLDVLTSAELFAKRELPGLLIQLRTSVGQMP